MVLARGGPFGGIDAGGHRIADTDGMAELDHMHVQVAGLLTRVHYPALPASGPAEEASVPRLAPAFAVERGLVEQEFDRIARVSGVDFLAVLDDGAQFSADVQA